MTTCWSHDFSQFLIKASYNNLNPTTVGIMYYVINSLHQWGNSVFFWSFNIFPYFWKWIQCWNCLRRNTGKKANHTMYRWRIVRWLGEFLPMMLYTLMLCSEVKCGESKCGAGLKTESIAVMILLKWWEVILPGL